MSKPADVLNAIKTALLANDTVAKYVQNNVLMGVRDNIIFFPCILVELQQLTEEDYTYPIQKQTMTAVVVGLFKVMDPETQLDEILDFLNNVKIALCSDTTLGGKAVHLVTADASFSQEMYPVRSFQLTVRITFEQNARTRT